MFGPLLFCIELIIPMPHLDLKQTIFTSSPPNGSIGLEYFSHPVTIEQERASSEIIITIKKFRGTHIIAVC